MVVISESGVIKNSDKNKNETNKNASNNDKEYITPENQRKDAFPPLIDYNHFFA